MTDVKLVRDLHTTNVDQLHAYLGQHEYYANEYESHAQTSTPLSITYPSNNFQSSDHHNVYNPSSSIPQVEYAPSVHQQSDVSQPDTGLVVLVFQKGDDPIDVINHMMSFLTVVVTSRYPRTNEQLRNSSNPRQQATINNAKIALMANLSHYGFDNLAESLEIDNLKHTLSEYLKEKESFEQMATLLKNDFQKEESRNIDRELALESSVIQITNAIVIRDSEETLMLEDESHSKMLQK
nr:hypothetical protein [Tanacetum cinerariifolium]